MTSDLLFLIVFQEAFYPNCKQAYKTKCNSKALIGLFHYSEMAEMHANRTHPRRSARLTTALKAAETTRFHPSPISV